MALDKAAPRIRRADILSSRERDDLAVLLAACVNEGASLGFLAPLTLERARAWWDHLPKDGIVLLVAEQEDQIIGTVQLLPAESENGAHRGDVAKLLVHPAWRRQGIARALMTRLETEARAAGKTLLVLDTREGDPSNHLYRSLGYVEVGRIPGWSLHPNGVFSATVYWYKVVGP